MGGFIMTKFITGDNSVPVPLRIWFVIHFAIDILFALPLFVATETFLKTMGWAAIDPITARMVAAALFSIGIESLLCRNMGRDVFISMLNLKIIWSLFAIIGLTIALISGLFPYIFIGVFLLVTFALFNLLWIYWRIKIN